MRLARAHEVGIDDLQLLDAVGAVRARRSASSSAIVARRPRRDDQLAAPRVRHVVARAELVQQSLPSTHSLAFSEPAG